MCLNPLEISYSHIAEITLQAGPNVIFTGFPSSTSIPCQCETVTSNIMDFLFFGVRIYSRSHASFHSPTLSISVLRSTFPVPVVAVESANSQFQLRRIPPDGFSRRQRSQNVLVLSLLCRCKYNIVIMIIIN